MDYLVIIESAQDGSYSAYVPDLLGCTSCGDTLDEVEQLIQEAIQIHIESLREHGNPVPPPTSRAITVRADAA